MNSPYNATSGLILASLAFAIAASAHAQDAATDTEGDAKEIVVTAQRRSERLQDVPMSVTAITSDMLTRQNINNTGDIARVAPSVIMPNFGVSLQPAVRGVSSTGAGVGDNPNVAIYIDGVYQAFPLGSLIDLPDIQQVEVLKGPQGALYGQNATGGAILLTSKAPSFSATGKLSASYGNHDASSLRGYVSGPLSNTIAVSVSGGYQKRDGFRTHVVTGEHDRGLDSLLIRGKLLFQPSDSAKITLNGFYTNRSDSATWSGAPINGNSVAYLFFPNAPKVTSPKQTGANTDSFTRLKAYGGGLTGEFDLGPGMLNTITSYSRNKGGFLADLDFTPVNYAVGNVTDRQSQYFIQEANFVSKKMGAFSFLVGGFYMTGHESGTAGTQLRTATLPPSPLGAITFQQPKYSRLLKEIKAVYADLTYDVAQDLIFTLGGRYTFEAQRAFANFTLPAPNSLVVTEFPGGEIRYSEFTPRGTLRWAVSPQSNLYASVSRGFKSGLINASNFNETPLRPETITAYEVGYKGSVIDGLKFDISAFVYNYRDLQVVAFVAPLYLQQNAATARIKGIDMDASWTVAPEITLSASASVLDAKYRRFPGAQVFIPNGTGNSAVTRDLSGHQMLRAPKFAGNVSADYRIETSAGRFGLFASAYYNSGYGLEISDRVRTGAYATVDAEISFEPADIKGLRLALWGKNLGDKDYLTMGLSTAFGDSGAYAEPRTFGVRAELDL